MKKSQSVQIGLLASVAAALAGCENSTRVHLDQYGRCVSDGNGSVLSPSICNGSAQAGGGGYYYGGSHYVYSSPASSGTVRGVFGESASGHGSSGGASGAGE